MGSPEGGDSGVIRMKIAPTLTKFWSFTIIGAPIKSKKG